MSWQHRKISKDNVSITSVAELCNYLHERTEIFDLIPSVFTWSKFIVRWNAQHVNANDLSADYDGWKHICAPQWRKNMLIS